MYRSSLEIGPQLLFTTQIIMISYITCNRFINVTENRKFESEINFNAFVDSANVHPLRILGEALPLIQANVQRLSSKFSCQPIIRCWAPTKLLWFPGPLWIDTPDSQKILHVVNFPISEPCNVLGCCAREIVLRALLHIPAGTNDVFLAVTWLPVVLYQRR